MEKAAIFCLAELERTKGGGLILRQPEEKMVFIAEYAYPFWLVPWENRNLLFDGLRTKSHTFKYAPFTDVKIFIENAKGSARDLETYINFLSESINYFQQPQNKKEIVLEWLITDANINKEFELLVSEAQEFGASSIDMAKLNMAIEETEISSIIQEIANLKAEFREEIGTLYEGIEFLSKKTYIFVKEIRGQIKGIKEEFDEKIKEQKIVVKSKVNCINEAFDEEIKQLAKNFEKQLLPLKKEKIKLEKTREQLQNKIERYKIEEKTCASEKDVVGERKWKEKIAEGKKEKSEIEKQIRSVKTEIGKLGENKSAETFKLRSKWEMEINEAKKDLLELEAARDARIEFYEQKIERLKSLTSTINDKIDKMAKMRTADLSELENMGMKQKLRTATLVYVPFYMACYQRKLKNRYAIFPPSEANSISFLAKIKGALGMAKIKQLLVPRFEAITIFLEKIPLLIEQDAAFEREMFEIGEKFNILKRSTVKEKIDAALKEFKNEGWLSEKDYENLSQRLA